MLRFPLRYFYGIMAFKRSLRLNLTMGIVAEVDGIIMLYLWVKKTILGKRPMRRGRSLR